MYRVCGVHSNLFVCVCVCVCLQLYLDPKFLEAKFQLDIIGYIYRLRESCNYVCVCVCVKHTTRGCMCYGF